MVHHLNIFLGIITKLGFFFKFSHAIFQENPMNHFEKKMIADRLTHAYCGNLIGPLLASKWVSKNIHIKDEFYKNSMFRYQKYLKLCKSEEGSYEKDVILKTDPQAERYDLTCLSICWG